MTKRDDMRKQLEYANNRALSEYWNGYAMGLRFALMPKQEREAIIKRR